MDASSQLTNQVLASVQSQFQTVIDSLQVQIAALQAEIAQLRTQSVTTAAPTSRPRPRLPDPVKFDGKQHRFRVWLPEVKAKIAVDDEAIGNDIAKFFYVYGCLEPTVQAMVLPQLAIAEKEKRWDYNTILLQLSRAYTNPNEVFEAEEALHAIKQGDQPLPAYIARFERLLYEAEGQDWNDTNKIMLFRAGLSPSLRKVLSLQLVLPTDYPGYLSSVQQINRRSPHASASTTHAHGQNSDKMDVSAINISSISRARSTSPLGRQQWREKGLCVRCGSASHWVKACPLQPASPSASSRRPFVKPQPSADQSDGSENDFDGSGSDGLESDREEGDNGFDTAWAGRPLSP